MRVHQEINGQGEVNRYKARLVAKGFAQKNVVDYTEIFSPVVKMTSIRLILAFAAAHNYEVEQMDVKTTFTMSLRNTFICHNPKDLRSKVERNMCVS